MKMNEIIPLDDVQIEEIKNLAGDKRSLLKFGDEIPIANDISTILERLNIKLLEFPIKSEGDRPAFSAVLMYSVEDGEEFVFIGLNTADYFDKQIFAIAHELFHYFTKTKSRLSRSFDDADNIIEAKANRFAAEFLFPEDAIKRSIIDEFKTLKLYNLSEKAILRFIARLQCTWWLPYRSLVRRLHEIAAINDEQYEKLYSIKERDSSSEYMRMGLAFNLEIFNTLNSKTNKIGTSMRDIEIILRNFEDGLISEDKLADTLSLFGKSPDDFGYKTVVSKDDEDEFEEFFAGGDMNED